MPRAIWSGSISFGLVNIPVKLYSAVSRKTVHFNQLDVRTGARVKQKRVDAETGEEVPWDQIVKGYELDSGAYVTDQRRRAGRPRPEGGAHDRDRGVRRPLGHRPDLLRQRLLPRPRQGLQALRPAGTGDGGGGQGRHRPTSCCAPSSTWPPSVRATDVSCCRPWSTPTRSTTRPPSPSSTTVVDVDISDKELAMASQLVESLVDRVRARSLPATRTARPCSSSSRRRRRARRSWPRSARSSPTRSSTSWPRSRRRWRRPRTPASATPRPTRPTTSRPEPGRRGRRPRRRARAARKAPAKKAAPRRPRPDASPPDRQNPCSQGASGARSMTTMGTRSAFPRSQAAIAGIGCTEFSKDSRMSTFGLAARAVKAAVADAGLELSDVDGLATFGPGDSVPPNTPRPGPRHRQHELTSSTSTWAAASRCRSSAARRWPSAPGSPTASSATGPSTVGPSSG